jgi:peptidoglycan/LPS O-acetylase OafA/YrhL
MAPGAQSIAGVYVDTNSAPAAAIAKIAVTRAPSTYYPAFDWMRISLAFMVMLHHADLFPWGQLGHFRVQVFFALSGWLIGRILLKTPSEELPRFYFGRVVRIWIPYALALGLLIGASIAHDDVTPKYLEFLLYKLTFVYNLFGTTQLAEHSAQMPLQGTGNHFWSICAEEQFYLCAPLLLTLMPGRLGRSPWLWLVIAATGVFSSIALGVAASLAHARWGALHLRASARAALGVLLVSGATIIWWDASWYEYAVPLVAIAIVLLLANPGQKGPWGEFLGGMSYQLYLNHWVGLFVAHSVSSRFGLDEVSTTLLLGFPLSIALAGVLYVLVDKRAMANRDNWYSPARAKAAMVTAYATTGVGLLSAAAIHLSR